MDKLDAKALEDIDVLVAFCAKSERNMELMQMFTRAAYLAEIPGVAAVFRKRLDEEKRKTRS